jgi:signal transduction histidine kinase
VNQWLKKIITAPLLYFIFMKIRPFTRKNVLLVLCAFALVVYSIYSWTVIGRLKAETSGLTRAYAELISMTVTDTISCSELHNVVEKLLHTTTNPIIFTDTSWNPVYWKNISHRRLHAGDTADPSADSGSDRSVILQRKISSLRHSFNPSPVYYGNDTTHLLGYLMYGNSILVRTLFVMPFLEISLGAAFVVLLYLAFHNIRVTERSNLWVGLAKETAHQLGTPLSSIMGWVEYLRATMQENPAQDSPETRKILNDMNNDLVRLSRITARFSQIGSIPKMVPCDVRNILTDVSSYFTMRLPLLRKRITIEYDFNQLPLVQANRDLLEWVFENILKNAIDAITCNDGKIGIKTEYLAERDTVRIKFSDNGKGISWESQKKVFSPGYTTKRRGWGLGLTLAKRIIDDYHKGEIYVAWSQRDKGTIFHVDLPVSKKTADPPA